MSPVTAGPPDPPQAASTDAMLVDADRVEAREAALSREGLNITVDESGRTKLASEPC